MDRIEVVNGGLVAHVGPTAVNVYRMQTLARGLKMEIMGMRMTRKTRTCYAIIKSEYGLKGNKKKVLAQFLPLVEQAVSKIPVVEVER